MNNEKIKRTICFVLLFIYFLIPNTINALNFSSSDLDSPYWKLDYKRILGDVINYGVFVMDKLQVNDDVDLYTNFIANTLDCGTNNVCNVDLSRVQPYPTFYVHDVDDNQTLNVTDDRNSARYYMPTNVTVNGLSEGQEYHSTIEFINFPIYRNQMLEMSNYLYESNRSFNVTASINTSYDYNIYLENDAYQDLETVYTTLTSNVMREGSFYIDFQSLPYDKTVVFNIDPSIDHFKIVTNGGGFYYNIFFNYNGTGTIEIENEVPGIILAPNADVIVRRGSLQQVICNNLTIESGTVYFADKKEPGGQIKITKLLDDPLGHYSLDYPDSNNSYSGKNTNFRFELEKYFTQFSQWVNADYADNDGKDVTFEIEEEGIYRVKEVRDTSNLNSDFSISDRVIYAYVPEPYYTDEYGVKFYPSVEYFIKKGTCSYDFYIYDSAGTLNPCLKEANSYIINNLLDITEFSISKNISWNSSGNERFNIKYEFTIDDDYLDSVGGFDRANFSIFNQSPDASFNIDYEKYDYDSGTYYPCDPYDVESDDIDKSSCNKVTINSEMKPGNQFSIKVFSAAKLSIIEEKNDYVVDGEVLRKVIPTITIGEDKIHFDKIIDNDVESYKSEEIDLNDVSHINVMNEAYNRITLMKKDYSINLDPNNKYLFDVRLKPTEEQYVFSQDDNGNYILTDEIVFETGEGEPTVSNLYIGNYDYYDNSISPETNEQHNAIKFNVELSNNEKLTFYYKVSMDYKIKELIDEDYYTVIVPTRCEANSDICSSTNQEANTEYMGNVSVENINYNSDDGIIDLVYKNYPLKEITITKDINGSGGNLDDEFYIDLRIFYDEDDRFSGIKFAPIITVNGEQVGGYTYDSAYRINNIGNEDTVSIKMLDGTPFNISEGWDQYNPSMNYYCSIDNFDEKYDLEQKDGDEDHRECMISGNAIDASFIFINTRNLPTPTGNKFNLVHYLLLIIIAITTFVIMIFIKRKTGGVKM